MTTLAPRRSAPHAPAGAKWLADRYAAAECARPCSVRLPRAVLTICFDEVTEAAALTGAAALERIDARGSFYASAARLGQSGPTGAYASAGDLRRLASSGHEIGCATYDHADCSALSVEESLSQCARNTIELALLGLPQPPRTIAYPSGRTRRGLKHALPREFVAGRGQAPGLNRGRADMAQLKAFAFFGWPALDPLLAALDRADRARAWMIVYTRDVRAEPGRHGAPTGALGALLRKARALKMDIAPLAETADRVLAADR